MKALTLTQPWATLVAIGAKGIETRSWKTSYRGPLAIHAAKGFPKYARKFTTLPECYEAVRKCYAQNLKGVTAYPLSAVVATCRLIAIHPVEEVRDELTTQELSLGNYDSGRYAWVLDDVRQLPEPIPAKGAQSLWEWKEPA